MRMRTVRTGAAVAIVATCVAAYYQSFQASPVAPVTSDSSNVQSVLDLPAMQYCAVENRPVVWYAQQEFLTTEPVRVEGDPNFGITWLDVSIPDEGEPTIVRYYASERDLKPCQFGLLNAGESPAMHHFTREGKPFAPASDQRCFSYMPPVITTDDTGRRTAVLRCDTLVPYHHG